MTDDELRRLIHHTSDPQHGMLWVRDIARDALRFRWLASQAQPYFDGFQLNLWHETRDLRAAIDADIEASR